VTSTDARIDTSIATTTTATSATDTSSSTSSSAMPSQNERRTILNQLRIVDPDRQQRYNYMLRKMELEQ
jgi:hypothetical protein